MTTYRDNYQFRANSLDNWTIYRMCRRNGVVVDDRGSGIFALLPQVFGGTQKWVAWELTNCTRRELLEAIAG